MSAALLERPGTTLVAVLAVTLALGALGLVFAPTAPAIAAGAALASLLLYEHAFVQAGQSVPLA